MLYEGIEHADDAVVRFGDTVCFEKCLEVCLGNLTDSFFIKQIEKP